MEDPVDRAAISLATRGRRLAGAFVDLLFYAGAALIVMVLGGFSWDPLAPEALLLLYAALAVTSGVNLYFLHQSGQSLGKRIVGTRIVMIDGARAGLGRIFLLRMLAPGIIGWVPYIGFPFGLANILFIFREDRRCLHDHLAGTMVVVA